MMSRNVKFDKQADTLNVRMSRLQVIVNSYHFRSGKALKDRSEFTLRAGDSLMRSIDKGLANSKSGIVVISKAFIEKKWPEYELRGLITLEMASKNNKVIPVWYGVSRDEVMAFSPTLARG